MSGARLTLVLLHPFPMDASFWGPMWRELAAPVDVLTPEFPGFGGAPPEEGATVAGFAASVAEAIRAEPTGRAIVAGLSLGGYVALALAAEHPDVVSGLLLANTRAEADDEAARRARERGIDTVRIDGLDTYLRELLPRLLGPDASSDAWERADAIASSQSPDAVCVALEALRDRPDRTGALGGIGVPTFVVGGSADEVTPAASIDRLAAGIPGATQRVIARAGHLSALEQPGAFADIVRELILEVETLSL